MGDKLGLREVVAMGVGGLIGGGIFAVLGVATEISGNAAFLSYAVSGLIALASGYSYVKLTGHLKEEGGSFTFLEHYVSNKNIAGMVGWVLILGYIGTMAMYSFAFGAFTAELLRKAGIGFNLLRPLLSAGVMLVFLAVNLFGVKTSGESEDIMVYTKVLILLLFSLTGLWAILTRPELTFFSGGVFNYGFVSPVVAIGSVFVSFEGFQLLTYEYSEIEGGMETLKKGVLYSIAISTLIYVLVALVTTNLLRPEQIMHHKETVLAFAASRIFQSQLINSISFVLVSIAAIFSTASAINATLFGTARFSYKVATEDELPELFSFRNRKGVPSHSLYIITALTMAFTVLGSLEEITTFASLAFLAIFGTVNYISIRDSGLESNNLISGFGLVGTLAATVLLLQRLYTESFHMLVSIAGIFAALLVLEFLFFERESIEEEVEEIEEEVEKAEESIEDEAVELEEDL